MTQKNRHRTQKVQEKSPSTQMKSQSSKNAAKSGQVTGFQSPSTPSNPNTAFDFAPARGFVDRRSSSGPERLTFLNLVSG